MTGDGILEIKTTSPQQTRELGRVLGEMFSGGEAVALMGELGSGKTVLAKGICQGLGVLEEGEVSSPSFVLVNEYQGRLPVYHLDLFRLGRGEAEELGWEEFFSGPAVVLVEWAEKAPGLLPPERLEARLEWLSPTERKVSFRGRGEGAAKLIARLGRIWLEKGG